MSTIIFRLSAKTDSVSGKSEILIRFFHGSLDQRAKTGIFVLRDYWSQDAQKLIIPKFRLMDSKARAVISELSEQNTALEGVKEHISQRFIEDGAGSRPLPGDWLSGRIREYLYPDEGEISSMLDILQHYIEVSNVGKSRKLHYEVLWRAVKRFFLFSGISVSLPLESMTTDNLRSFVEYLKNEHSFYTFLEDADGNKRMVFLDPRFANAYNAVPESRPPAERGQNAINHFLSELRAFFNWAKNNGYTSNDPFSNYEVPASIYGTPYYITIEERNQLYKHDLSDCPRLEAQRDIFVFQCVIGCRVSDLRSLTKGSVIDGAIEYIPRKTKEGNPVTVRVPLNAVAREILERYKDIPGSKLLPCISDQNYNYAIKEVFKAAGLTRPVTILNPTTRMEEKRPLNEVASSHLARRCFIGNLYKQVKDPNLIGKLSGHSEGSRAFARYRDIDEEMRKELVSMLE